MQKKRELSWFACLWCDVKTSNEQTFNNNNKKKIDIEKKCVKVTTNKKQP